MFGLRPSLPSQHGRRAEAADGAGELRRVRQALAALLSRLLDRRSLLAGRTPAEQACADCCC